MPPAITSYWQTGRVNRQAACRPLRRRLFALVALSIALYGGHAAVADPLPPNRIQQENALPGDPSWLPGGTSSNPAVGQLEGYASPVSVNVGEAVRFYASTLDPTFTATIYRLGWYGGAGARKMTETGGFVGSYHHNDVHADPATGLVEARDWPNFHTMTIPAHWTSGIYVARLLSDGAVTGSPHLAYIVFVVRDDHRAADFAFQSSVNTNQAYNNWGGKSLYGANSVGGVPAVKVSLNRPNAVGPWGLGDFVHWELNLLRFMEKEGYDVTYLTNIDTQRNGHFLRRHKAFLSVGHDEYWTTEMRQNVEVLRNLGIHLGFIGSNVCYWQIRYEDSPYTGEPYRTIVAYKEAAATADPFALDNNPTNDFAITTRWRDTLLGHVANPEDKLLGVKAHAALANQSASLPLHITVPVDPMYHWVFNGTGLAPGGTALLWGLLGYETDSATDKDSAPPAGTTILAHSPDPGGHANMTIYQWDRGWNFWGPGARVFATGTMNWTHGLDSTAPAETQFNHPVAKQITRNIFNCFAGTGPCETAPPSP